MARKGPIMIDTSDLKESNIMKEAMMAELEAVEAKASKKGKKGASSSTSRTRPQDPDVTSAPLTPQQREVMENGFQIPNAAKVMPTKKAQAQPATAKDYENAMHNCKIIENYHKHFGQVLGKHQPINLQKTSPAEVEAIKKETFKEMDRQFGPMLAKQSIGYFAYAFEYFWMTFCFNHPMNPFGAGLHNLTDLGEIMSSPEAQIVMEPLLMEWQIRYPAIFEQPLWVRTLHAFGQICHEVSKRNRGRPSSADAADISKYADL